jgi:hypothetical protein
VVSDNQENLDAYFHHGFGGIFVCVVCRFLLDCRCLEVSPLDIPLTGDWDERYNGISALPHRFDIFHCQVLFRRRDIAFPRRAFVIAFEHGDFIGRLAYPAVSLPQRNVSEGMTVLI